MSELLYFDDTQEALLFDWISVGLYYDHPVTGSRYINRTTQWINNIYVRLMERVYFLPEPKSEQRD